MQRADLVFLAWTYGDERVKPEKMFGRRQDVVAVCKKCSLFEDCDWENDECCTQFCDMCNSGKPIFYESDLNNAEN